MTGINDDSLHQLVIDVPLVVSAFYHYIPLQESSLKVHLIAGASRIEVESSYPGVVDSSDTFTGISYGIGFEESFESMPRLKLSLDWIQLYSGKELDINTTSFGVHYEF